MIHQYIRNNTINVIQSTYNGLVVNTILNVELHKNMKQDSDTSLCALVWYSAYSLARAIRQEKECMKLK